MNSPFHTNKIDLIKLSDKAKLHTRLLLYELFAIHWHETLLIQYSFTEVPQLPLEIIILKLRRFEEILINLIIIKDFQ